MKSEKQTEENKNNLFREKQMENKQQGTPSFFKVLLCHPVEYLPLPIAFVKKHLEGRVPMSSVLKAGSDRSWSVDIAEIRKKWCFADGWLKFMKDNKVEVGDFAVFWLLGDFTTFEVVLYGSDGCEKAQHLVRKRKFSSTVLYETSGSCSSTPPSNGAKPRKSTRTRKKSKAEKEVEHVHAVARNPKLPSFEKLVMKSHGFAMPFSAKFFRESGLAHRRNTVLRDPKGRVWPVGIEERCYGTIHSMTAGWRHFWNANKLQPGDTCVFQLLPEAENGNVIEVQLVRKTGRAG